MAVQIEQETATDSLSTKGQVQLGVIPLWVPAFFGDSNRWLKAVQCDAYPALTYEFFDAARRRYLSVPELVAADTELADGLREIAVPDAPFLPRVYRRIAAFYRYAFDRSASAERDGRDEPVMLDRQQTDWKEFFRSEAGVLAANATSDRFIVYAAVCPGERAGAAEEGLVLMLRQRYGVLTLRRRVELLRRLPRHGDWNARLRAAQPAGELPQDPQVRPNPPD
jgi:hypothetical protein